MAQAFEIPWSFTCDHALIDTNGKISIIGIFDRLFAAAFPVLHPALFVVAGWAGAPGAGFVTELRFWSPAQELIATVQQQVQLGPDGRSTGIIHVSPLGLPVPGDYIIEFLVGTESLRHHGLSVLQVEQQR